MLEQLEFDFDTPTRIFIGQKMTINEEVTDMALKNLFDMAKADRYTADGREAIIKAQEAETEDKVYQIGEISQKTGLQKTANGWVKPKKGAAPAKKENPTRTFEFKAGPDGNPVAGSGKEVKTYKTKKEAEAALKKQNAAAGSQPAAAPKTGVPIQGSNWLSLPSGTRMTFEGAKEKMAKNNERIETIKKMMEGKSRADNFRLGAELKRLQNENEWIAERLPPEKTESPSASGSDYNKAHAQLTQLKASAPELQNDFDDHRDIVLKRVERGQPLNEAFETYEKEMKASVPRMVEQDIMSKEEGDRYIKAWEDFKKQATSESQPAASKEPKLKEGVMNSRKAKAFKPELEEIRKTDPSRFRENLMDILSSWTDENEGYLKNSSLTNLMNIYNYERNQMYETGDAAPRVLTGDCRIRIRKEKPALTGDTRIRVRK